MYAIIETGGKQLKVEVGDTIFVEKLDVAEGETVVLVKFYSLVIKQIKLVTHISRVQLSQQK